MRNELRIGRLRGSGAVINITTANQVIGGLSVTLDIPGGASALVTITCIVNLNNSAAYVNLELDGTVTAPNIAVSGTGAPALMGAQTWLLSPGKRALRTLVGSNSNAGTLDPVLATLSWIIAPQGGQA